MTPARTLVRDLALASAAGWAVCLGLAVVAPVNAAGNAPPSCAPEPPGRPVVIVEQVLCPFDPLSPSDALCRLYGDPAALIAAGPPDDARSWATLRTWFNGPDAPPAPVPIAPTALLLLTALATLTLKGHRK